MKSHIWIFWIHNMEQFSHPERIETCFLVVIECYRWFKMIYKYSYLIPIFYFLVKDPTSPSFSGLLQGNAFRSSNPNPQLVYLSLVDVPGPQTAPIFLPVDLNIHKRWVVFLNLWNHLFFGCHGFIMFYCSFFILKSQGIRRNQATCLEFHVLK